MSQVNLPTGRVFSTAARDLNRALVRGADDGPARPTKTLVSAFMAPGSFAASFAAYAEGGATEEGAETHSADVMPLVGGWSLTTDDNGSLMFLHDDGSRQVIAVRTVPATGEDQSNG